MFQAVFVHDRVLLRNIDLHRLLLNKFQKLLLADAIAARGEENKKRANEPEIRLMCSHHSSVGGKTWHPNSRENPVLTSKQCR
jgi:hypothetical protein